LRISELISIQYEDLDLKGRRCKVIGKGNRQGWAFWGYGGAVALRGYLRVRKGPKHGPLFLGTSPRNEGEPLTDDAIRTAMKRLAQQASVELPPGAPPHSMRHRFGHKGIESGLDSSEVGQLMRHRHHTATLRYLRENADRLSKIHERIRIWTLTPEILGSGE
jgi:integrase/recombinase XerD